MEIPIEQSPRPAADGLASLDVRTRTSAKATRAVTDPDALRAVPMLADLGDGDLAWIAAQSECVELEPGQILFRPGEPAEWMVFVLAGVLQMRREQLGPNAPAYVFRAGDISGTVPFSRMKIITGTGRAVGRTVLALFPRASFGDLLRRVPALEGRFVSHLVDRVRESTRRDAQFEKFVALGKLSAGLAHELNNPVSAVLRAMSEARARLDERGEITASLVSCGMRAETVRRLDALRRRAAVALPTASAYDGADRESDAAALIAQSEREEALGAWLRDEVGARDPWTSAPVFVEAGIDREMLEEALRDVPPSARGTAVRWVEIGLSAQALFAEAEASSRRIVQLLDALATYTHRDRMREMVDVDIRDGLESTLELCDARARGKRLTIERVLDPVPRIRAYPGDLNQAWANLIDNAIEAAPAGHGKVTVRTGVDDGCIVAEIRDNGPGIPAELHERIFEPFFTTKDVGAGAGLGLDIARRIIVDLHGGRLAVSSVPGDTRFTAHLPQTTIGTFGA